jgi:hypothetical protein
MVNFRVAGVGEESSFPFTKPIRKKLMETSVDREDCDNAGKGAIEEPGSQKQPRLKPL